MAELRINAEIQAGLGKAELEAAMNLCPFGAIDINRDGLSINSGCRMCKICVNNGPAGLFEFLTTENAKDTKENTKKSEWRGTAVYIEYAEGRIHPVSLELIGKAGSLERPVIALLIGHNTEAAAKELLKYGADFVYVYDDEKLGFFSNEPYAAAFSDFIEKVKPSAILVGATPAGRSLAPRVAARFRTGLTADCTSLEIKENGDLVQIRPAFGGNVMARIITPDNRPQMATVRYKIFDTPKLSDSHGGKIVRMDVPSKCHESKVKVLSVSKKERRPDIADADIIVACGRAFKSQKDLRMAYRLAELLGAEVACTRPLIEAGWFDPARQVGLSGRTVKPSLIITLGVSGAIQFKAGMQNSDTILSVNQDTKAPIFNVCHYAVYGDIYEVVPELIGLAEKGRGNHK